MASEAVSAFGDNLGKSLARNSLSRIAASWFATRFVGCHEVRVIHRSFGVDMAKSLLAYTAIGALSESRSVAFACRNAFALPFESELLEHGLERCFTKLSGSTRTPPIFRQSNHDRTTFLPRKKRSPPKKEEVILRTQTCTRPAQLPELRNYVHTPAPVEHLP